MSNNPGGTSGGSLEEFHSGTRERDNHSGVQRSGLDSEVLAQPGKKRNCGEAQAVIALLVLYEDHFAVADLSKRLGRDLSSLSQAVNRLRKGSETSPRPATELMRIREDLAQM
jgi:hypothetical protein